MFGENRLVIYTCTDSKPNLSTERVPKFHVLAKIQKTIISHLLISYFSLTFCETEAHIIFMYMTLKRVQLDLIYELYKLTISVDR